MGRILWAENPPITLGYLKQQIISNKDNGVGEYAFRDYSMACNTDEMDALQTEIGNWLNSLKNSTDNKKHVSKH